MGKGELPEAAPERFRRVDQGFLDRAGLVTDALTYYGLAIAGQLDVDELEEAWYALARKWPILLSNQVNPKTKRPCEFTAASPSDKDKAKAYPAGWFLEIPLEEHLEDIIAEHRARGHPTFRYALHEGSFNDRLPIPTPSELPSDKPSVIEMRDDMDIWVPNAPKRVKDFVGVRQAKRPVLHIEVNVYDDATILGISSPHAFMDALGLAEILRAWSKVVAGKGDEVKPLDESAPSYYNRYCKVTPEAPWGWIESTLVKLLLAAFTILLGTIRRPPWTIENRSMYLPPAYVAQLKAQCTEEIKASLGDKYDASRDWISTSDAINAWVLQMAQVIRKDKKGSLGYVATRNLRLAPPDPLPQPYLFNGLLLQVLDVLPYSDIFKKSRGELAHRFRTHMRYDMTPERTRAIVSWHAATLHGLPLPLPPTAQPFGVSNWSAAKFFDVDFSSAILDPLESSASSSAESGEKAGTPSAPARAKGSVFYVGGSSKVTIPMKDFITVRGIDADGGIWMSGVISRAEWNHPEGFGRFLVDRKTFEPLPPA